MVTAKKLWEKAKKRNPSPLRDRDYFLVGVSAIAGSVVSVLLSRIDFKTVKSLTNIVFVDFLIYAILLTIFTVVILYTILKLFLFLSYVTGFFTLLWEKKNIPKIRKR